MTQTVESLRKLVGPANASQLLLSASRRGLTEEQTHEAIHVLLKRFTDQAPPGEDAVTQALRFKCEPVSVREFVTSRFYLAKGSEIYPEVMADLCRMNNGDYDEAVLTGGIGSGKTTLALYSQAYQLYLLSLMRNPHAVFGLDRSSEIKIVFQSINTKLATGVDYARFRSMIDASPYFQRHFMFQQEIASKLLFPNRIEVEPIGGSETASIGQNVIGGVIDEVNFMAVTEKSKMAADGGTYDQAVELYNTIARRRKSRFMQMGRMPGLLCLVSSKRTPGQFTDVKEAEARTNKRIYVYNKRVWDIKPSSFSGECFQVFVGDELRKPRILEAHEKVGPKEAELIDSIPVEFLTEFKDDITKALRDIAGRSTMAIHPFMPDVERVTQNFGRRRSVIEQEVVDFSVTRPTLYPLRIENKEAKRFAHIDLSLSGDSAGLVIGHCPGFRMIKRNEASEVLPVIAIDCALEIAPPRGGEIEFSNIRRVLYKLREMGMPITWVTLDSYQSVDTMQILRSEGFVTGYQSIDTTTVPYQWTKAALYDGRLPMPVHAKLKKELLTLERDFKKNKIDHSAHGSKDIADALAGVVFGLTMRREIWAAYGVNPVSSPSIGQAVAAAVEKQDSHAQERSLR